MDELQRQALELAQQYIKAELDAGGADTLYALSRRWVGQAWDRGIRGMDPQQPALGQAPAAAPGLGGIWQPLVAPVAQGVSDEIERRLTALVRPTVEKAALLGGAGGLLVGYQLRKLLGR